MIMTTKDDLFDKMYILNSIRGSYFHLNIYMHGIRYGLLENMSLRSLRNNNICIHHLYSIPQHSCCFHTHLSQMQKSQLLPGTV